MFACHLPRFSHGGLRPSANAHAKCTAGERDCDAKYTRLKISTSPLHSPHRPPSADRSDKLDAYMFV